MIELPEFDTGQYEGCDFLMSQGNAVLTLRVAGLPQFVLHFKRVRWHEFTALYNCTPEQVKTSYFRLHEVSPSPQLTSFLANDRAPLKVYNELHHYRIFLDETGCHEVFAESARSGT